MRENPPCGREPASTSQPAPGFKLSTWSNDVSLKHLLPEILSQPFPAEGVISSLTWEHPSMPMTHQGVTMGITPATLQDAELLKGGVGDLLVSILTTQQGT